MIDQYPPSNGVLTSLIWRKTMSGGETSLSGYDNASQALSYTPGQEQVYLNGILLVRGDDYTATNGTSITGLAALSASDFVQVNCYNNFSVASLPASGITGTIANNQLQNSSITINGSPVSLGGSVSLPGDIESVTAGTGLSGGGSSGAVTLSLSTPVATTNGGTGLSSFSTGDLVYASGSNTLASRSIGTTGQVLTVSGGLPVWSAPAAGGAYTLLSTTAISGGTVSVTDISGSYTELIIVVTDFKAANDNSQPTFRFNNDSGNNYVAYSVISGVSYSGNVSGVDKVWFAGQTGGGAGLDNASNDGIAVMRIFRYASTDAFKTGAMQITYPQNDGYWYAVDTGFGYKSTSAINRFDLSCSGGWASQGNIYIYGAN